LFDVDDGVPVRHATKNLLLTISVNPTRRQLREVLHAVLTDPHPRYRHVVYSGLALSGTGCWLLCDGPFTYDDFVAVLQATEGDRRAPLHLSTFGDGNWTATRLARDVPDVEVVLNPEDKSPRSSEGFVEHLSGRIGVVEGGALLRTTETVGSLSFARPTLYVFPAGDGGSSLFFGIRDLTVVCDAGVGRCPAFWDFVRHFNHLDVLIGTHAGPDNVFGLQTFIERQRTGDLQILPKLGYTIFNGSPDAVTMKLPESPTLLVHLPEELAKMTNMLHDIGIPPHVCTSPAGEKTVRKINLYQKINQGSFDLYVAHPVEDSRELKEFRRQCSSQAPHFVAPGTVPLTDMVSAVAALVWKPCASTEKPVRIFLPGSAPLAKLYESLDRLQGIPLFELLSGSAEEHAPRTAPITKPSSSKPAVKPATSSQKPVSQSMPAVKSSASAKARSQARHSVTSPKGNREAVTASACASASRRSVSKPEPASKVGRGVKPPLIAHPTSATEKVKRPSEAGASSKMPTSFARTRVAGGMELPADNVSHEAVHDVKVDEAGQQELEEVVARDSVERDSLEASVADNAMQADSLCGEDKDYSEVHGECESDQNKPVETEKTAECNYGETLPKDTNMHAVRVEDMDSRVIAQVDDVISSSLGTSSSAWAGESHILSWLNNVNIVAEPDKASAQLDDPLCEAVHPGPVDAAEVAKESAPASCDFDSHMEPSDLIPQSKELPESTVNTDEGKAPASPMEQQQIGLPEAVDSEQIETQQEVTQEIEPDRVGGHQDVRHDFGDGNIQQSVEIVRSVPDEAAVEPINEGKLEEDFEVAGTEVIDKLKKEVDADIGTVTPDSGIIPQGLPSPQQEAERLEIEQEDLHDDAAHEAVDLAGSSKPVSDGKVLENQSAVDSNSELTEGCVEEKSELSTELHHSEDILSVSTGLQVVHSDQSEGASKEIRDRLTPETDELPRERELPVEELQTVMQEESESADSHIRMPQGEEMPDEDKVSTSPAEPQLIGLGEAVDSEQAETHREMTQEIEHIQPSDHMPHSEELLDPAVNTDEMPVSPIEPQETDTSKPEDYPVEAEPSLGGLTEPHDDDDAAHDADIPDTVDIVDDVPLSPVEQSAQEGIPKDSEQMSFYYTEPQIQLTENTDPASDMELPVSACSATGTDDAGQNNHIEQPQKESTSPDALPEPFDPIQSWGPPMGLPAPLNNDKDGGKKRENTAGAHGTKLHTSQLSQKTDTKSASSGKTGASAARDLSSGHNGRTATKPGKPAERPGATRRSVAPATDGSKVGLNLAH